MSSPRIFVSYARADAELGRTLTERLARDHGFTIWRDLADLEGGTDWWRQITDAIDHVEYLVLIMTPAALGSHVVREEWRYARRHGVCVIPVMGEPTLDFAELPEWMRRTHFVDSTEPEQWARFVRTLEGPCRALRVPTMAEPPPADFVARSQEFETLRTLLISEARGGSVAITTALKGAGGYGKTTLARALCYDEQILETYYDGILWVTLGEQPGDPAAMLEDLVVTLSGEASRLMSAEARKRRVDDLLADRSVLLVIDDVWNAAHLQPFLIGGDRCARLITTRDSHTLPPRTSEVRVDAMDTEEAVSLLQMGIPDADHRLLASLATRLGEWPLLLKLVNGMLRDRVHRAGDTAPRAIAYVNRLLDKRGYRAFDARDPVQRHDAVSVTVAASVVRLTRREQARLQELVIFPEDVGIPLDVVKLLWHRTGGLDEVETEECLQTLFSLSLLLEFNLTLRRLRIHDVIRQHLTAEVHPDELQRLHGELVEAYRERCPRGWSDGVDDGYFYHFLLFHLSAAGCTTEVRALLLEPAWIEAKLRRTDVAELLSDYATWASDHATHVMEDAVRLSGDVLANDPDAVVPQLLGRIDGRTAPEFAPLVDAWRRRPRPNPWLCPQTASLTSPGGTLVQTLRFGYLSPRSISSLSDDGRYVATRYCESVEVFDLGRTRQLVKIVAVSSDLTADGGLVAHGIGGYVELLDVATQKDIWTIQCPNDYPVIAVTVTPDARWIGALAGYWISPGTGAVHLWHSEALAGNRIGPGADAVHLWNSETKREVFTVERGGIRDFLISPDGDHVVLRLAAGVLEVWSVETGQRINRWECDDAMTIALGAERGEVIVGSPRGTVTVWTVGRDEARTTIAGHDEEAAAVAVTSDGRMIVLGFADGRLECRQIADGQLRSKTLRPALPAFHSGGWVSLAVTPDGRQLVSAHDADGAVRVWNLTQAASQDHRVSGVPGVVRSMTPDGQRLVVQSTDGSIAVRDEPNQNTIRLLGRFSPYGNPEITPDGRWVLDQGADGGWTIWNASTGNYVRLLGNRVTKPIITRDSRVVYAADNGAGRHVLWVEELKPELGSDAARSGESLDLDAGRIFALAMAPNTERLVAVAFGGVFTWDLGGRAPRRVVLDGAIMTPRRACTDGRVLVLSDSDRVEAWDVEAGCKVLDVKVANEMILAIALSPSARRLAIAHDRIVTVWSVGTGVKEGVFHAEAPVEAVASPSDTSFILASVDGHVHRLDLRDYVDPSAAHGLV
jgi:WD40 repeat protein